MMLAGFFPEYFSLLWWHIRPVLGTERAMPNLLVLQNSVNGGSKPGRRGGAKTSHWAVA
jgi:hypothetical protein